MFRLLATIQIILLLSLTAAADENRDQFPEPPAGKSWKLVWRDELSLIVAVYRHSKQYNNRQVQV